MNERREGGRENTSITQKAVKIRKNENINSEIVDNVNPPE